MAGAAEDVQFEFFEAREPGDEGGRGGAEIRIGALPLAENFAFVADDHRYADRVFCHTHEMRCAGSV